MRAPSRKGKSPDHFFKFIPPGQMSHVSIPEAVRKYFRNKTTAKLRRGCRKWPVKITDKWVFGEGWENFVRENGVEDFDIVVFKNEGKMVFDVMVFNHTWCEREYPTNQVTRMKVKKACPEAKSFQKRKIQIKGEAKVTPKEKAAHEYFKFTATAYSIKRCFVHVPLGFARSNGLDKRKYEMILMDEKQRLWPTKLSGCKVSHVRILGIREIQIANGIKEGDEFLVELVKNGKKPLMCFHSLNQQTKHFDTRRMVETKVVSKVTPKEKAAHEYPYFKFTATAYSIKHHFLNVPLSFARSNGFGKRKYKMIVMDKKKRLWSTKLNACNGDQVHITGIQDMLDANGIKEGDEFLLELVENGDKPLMNFHWVSKVKERAAYKYPYFKFTATTTSIKQSFVNIPLDFARSHGLDKGKYEIVVMDEKKRSWLAKIGEYNGVWVHITGIRNMIVANGLKVGDEVLLELVESVGDKLLMNLHCINRRQHSHRITRSSA